VATAHSRTFSPGDSIVITAIALSVAFHALLLAVHFADPTAFQFKPTEDTLEVVLVNAKAKTKPVKAAALAQHDLNGGGENDQGRVTSYLQKSEQASEGDVLKQSQAAVAHLEEEQRRLLTQARQTPVAVDPNARSSGSTQQSAADAEEAQNVMAQIQRLEAEISKENNDYNARPRRGYISPNTRGVSYATYYKEWQERIERIGTINYPAEARGKMYGDLILRVSLKPDGTIYNDEIKIVRGSGYPVLDRAAENIVRRGAPYHPFPDEMRRDYDVFEIISKFSWSKGDGFAARLERK